MPDFHFGHYTMTSSRPPKLYDWVRMRRVFLRPRELALLVRLVRGGGGIVPPRALERAKDRAEAREGARGRPRTRSARLTPPGTASARLRVALSRLRLELGPGSVKTQWAQGYRLGWDVRVGGRRPAPRVAR